MHDIMKWKASISSIVACLCQCGSIITIATELLQALEVACGRVLMGVVSVFTRWFFT